MSLAQHSWTACLLGWGCRRTTHLPKSGIIRAEKEGRICFSEAGFASSALASGPTADMPLVADLVLGQGFLLQARWGSCSAGLGTGQLSSLCREATDSLPCKERWFPPSPVFPWSSLRLAGQESGGQRSRGLEEITPSGPWTLGRGPCPHGDF